MNDAIPEAIQPQATADTSSIMRCYVLVGLGMPMMFLPVSIVSGIGMLLMLIGVIWAYRLRARSAPDDLVRNHAIWLIRSFWISSLYFIAAMGFTGAVISANADTSAIQNMSQGITDGSLTPDQVAGMVAEYMATNAHLILITTLLCFAPVVFHIIARCVLGYRRADKGLPVERLKTWLIR